MTTFKISGGGTLIAGGVLLLLLSVFVLVDPFSVGVVAVLVVAGAGLILLGCIMCYMAAILKDIHNTLDAAI